MEIVLIFINIGSIVLAISNGYFLYRNWQNFQKLTGQLRRVAILEASYEKLTAKICPRAIAKASKENKLKEDLNK